MADSELETQLSLRTALARSLRAKRCRTLLGDEDDAVPSGWGELFSWVFMGWFMVADGWFLADQMGWPPGLAWLGAVVIVIVAGTLLAAVTDPVLSAFVFAVAFIITGVTQLVLRGADDLLWTHGLSGLTVAALITASRARGLAHSVPLLLPLIIVVLFVPLFTADLWEAADNLTPRGFAALGALVLIPLLAAVFRRMSPGLPRTLQAATKRIAVLGDPENRVVQLLKSVGSEEKAWVTSEEPRLRAEIHSAFDPDKVATTGENVADQMLSRLRRLLAWRLFSTALGAGTLVTVYVYLLAWAAVTAKTAAGFVSHPIRMHSSAVLGDLPLGPFLHVALLFGLVATAVFLAFALTEEDYADALSDSMVARPFEDILLLAVPYRAAAGVRDV